MRSYVIPTLHSPIILGSIHQITIANPPAQPRRLSSSKKRAPLSNSAESKLSFRVSLRWNPLDQSPHAPATGHIPTEGAAPNTQARWLKGGGKKDRRGNLQQFFLTFLEGDSQQALDFSMPGVLEGQYNGHSNRLEIAFNLNSARDC